MQRAAYRTALVASHKEKDVRPFAALIKACVARGWAALESAWASKRAAAAQEAAGARQRSARDEVRSSNCIICLDGGPSMTLVCCGGAFCFCGFFV